ncbi:hypothetical protein C3L33_21833, partial [Rhododendron williamsianum]
MGNEVFRVISVPFILPVEFDKCDVKPYNGDRIALYQFKGFPGSGLDKCCDIWVMEEEGSWIKQFSVGTIPCRAFQQGVWKNGELLFLEHIQASYDRRYVYQLVLYNPCTRELRYLGPAAEDFIGYQALVYHESLVSVNGLVFSEYLHSGLVLSFKEVNDEEPLFPAVSLLNLNKLAVPSGEAEDAAAAIVAWLQLGTKLSDVVTNKSDALGLFDLFRYEGYILTEHEGRFCRFQGREINGSSNYGLLRNQPDYALLAVSYCEAHVDWTSEALGCFPEAMNLWIGNELSVTSFHRDHYENLYAVVTGEKHFLLLPPTDVHRMYIQTSLMLSTTTQRSDSGELKLELEDPAKYVFHHVRQTPDSRGSTIAINYWDEPDTNADERVNVTD